MILEYHIILDIMLDETEIATKIIKIPDRYLYILYLVTLSIVSCVFLSFGGMQLRGWIIGYILSGYLVNYINGYYITYNIGMYQEYIHTIINDIDELQPFERRRDEYNIEISQLEIKAIPKDLFYLNNFKKYEDYTFVEKILYAIVIFQYCIGFNLMPEISLFYIIDHKL